MPRKKLTMQEQISNLKEYMQVLTLRIDILEAQIKNHINSHIDNNNSNSYYNK